MWFAHSMSSQAAKRPTLFNTWAGQHAQHTNMTLIGITFSFTAPATPQTHRIVPYNRIATTTTATVFNKNRSLNSAINEQRCTL